MKVLVTFLGTGNYQTCRYQLGDCPPTGESFFSAALAAHIQPGKVFSLETAEASARHGIALAARFAELNIPHTPVQVPSGASETELWEIFSALTTHIPQGCTLHLDITHGFRSLPLLGFLALSYLRVTRGITIGGIHYGAYEARDAVSNIAPAFDLTPFLVLLDWTAAADSFLTTGSASRLGSLLCETQQSMWQAPGDLTPSDLPRKLKSLGSNLTTASSDLILLRTRTIADSSQALGKSLQAAQSEAAVHAAPFLEVLKPVTEQLTQFREPDLATLRTLVTWLAGRGHAAAALTLASEWLTSFVLDVSGSVAKASYDDRKPAADILSNLEGFMPDDKLTLAAAALLQIIRERCSQETLTLLPRISSTVRNARNDINHAGFNESPASSATLISRAKEVAGMLLQLPLAEHPSAPGQ